MFSNICCQWPYNPIVLVEPECDGSTWSTGLPDSSVVVTFHALMYHTSPIGIQLVIFFHFVLKDFFKHWGIHWIIIAICIVSDCSSLNCIIHCSHICNSLTFRLNKHIAVPLALELLLLYVSYIIHMYLHTKCSLDHNGVHVDVGFSLCFMIQFEEHKVYEALIKENLNFGDKIAPWNNICHDTSILI